MRDEKNKLFVGNLSFNIDSDQLAELFGEVENVEVKEAKVVMDRMTGKPRGFGFVTLANEEMVQKAISAMDNKEIDGRNISVKVATPQRDDRGGDRGGFQNNFRSGSSRRY